MEQMEFLKGGFDEVPVSFLDFMLFMDQSLWMNEIDVRRKRAAVCVVALVRKRCNHHWNNDVSRLSDFVRYHPKPNVLTCDNHKVM